MKKNAIHLALLLLPLLATGCKQDAGNAPAATEVTEITDVAIIDVADDNPAYTEQVRRNAQTFHKNFSSGDFDKNGPLVTDNIYVNSNNVIVIGRDKFINRIKRYHTPFPELKLHDHVVLVDGNVASLWYVLQGEQTGPLGETPASGNKINVYSSEFFTMDDNALMKELLTITQLDRMHDQVTGKTPVTEYESIELLPVSTVSADFKHQLKNNLDAYAANFNARNWDDLQALFADNVAVNWNGTIGSGFQAVKDGLNLYASQLPDQTLHTDRNVVEGKRGAAAFTLNGTYHKGDDSKQVQARQSIQVEFDDNGKIVSLVAIHNENDVKEQLD